MPSALTSAGRATSERAALENELTGVMLAGLRTFLSGVEADATAALRAPVLLASANPFSLASVLLRWGPVVKKMLAALVHRLHPSKEVLAGVERRLTASVLPAAAHSTVVSVLSSSSQQVLSHAEVTRQLRSALSMETAALVRVSPTVLAPAPSSVNWAAVARMHAATEATTAYSSTALTRLSEAGAASKRWVAHHDKLTRPSHAVADGQTQPLDQPFMVGGAALMFPGDHNGPLAETANCRCVIVDAGIDALKGTRLKSMAPRTGSEAEQIPTWTTDADGSPVLTLVPGKIVPTYANPPGHLAVQEAQFLGGYQADSAHYELMNGLRSGRIVQPVRPTIWGESALLDYPASTTGQIQALDAVISRTVTSARSVVYRGLAADSPFTPGMEFVDKGYTSVTSLPSVAQEFAQMRSGSSSPDLMPGAAERPVGGLPMVARIVLPKGTAIARIWDSSIKEMVLARDTKFRVLSVDGPEVLMEIIP